MTLHFNIKKIIMKITIKEDGSLLIDGEGDTTIVKNITVKDDWIKIEGGHENASHEAFNFYLKHENTKWQYRYDYNTRSTEYLVAKCIKCGKEFAKIR